AERHVYTFTGNPGQQLYFDALSGSAALYSPSGQTLFGSVSFDTGLITLTESGTYRLVVDGDATGSYSFNLLDLADQPVINAGTEYTGSLDPDSSVAIFRFNATANQRIFLDSLTSSTENYWYLYGGPTGQLLNYNWGGSDFKAVAPSSGTYTL